MPDKINISPRKKILIVNLLLILAMLAVYWQVNQYGFVNRDDDIYVTANSYVQSGITAEGIRWAFSSIDSGYWYPLTWLSFMLDCQIHGMNAGGYHVTNLILHIFTTLFLFWLFCRMTGSLWKSAFVAALFALHPFNVEAVAYVSGRKDLLCAFFWMLTLYLYIYYTEKPVIRRYLLVAFSFLLALMSKSMVVTLPLIMILLDYWPLKRFASRKGNLIVWQLKEKMPLLIFSAIFSAITLHAQYNPYIKITTLNFRIANAFVSLENYLSNIFWPRDLAIIYPYLYAIDPDADKLPLLLVFGSLILIFVISVAAISTIKRFPFLFVGWLWYLITILPVLGITQTGPHWIHDHYNYLPFTGIVLGLAWGIDSLVRNEEIRKKILLPVAMVMLLVMAFMSWQQCRVWKDSITLFSHALRVTENNPMAHDNLGSALCDEGSIEEAIYHFNKAIDLKPQAGVYSNRGIAYGKAGLYEPAVNDFSKAIAMNPYGFKAYNNRGFAYAGLGYYRWAIEDYTKAIELNPDYGRAYNNRGIAYFAIDINERGCSDAQRACERGLCGLWEKSKNMGICH